MCGEGGRASSLGALYLTNVQQFYERQSGGQDEPEENRPISFAESSLFKGLRRPTAFSVGLFVVLRCSFPVPLAPLIE
jgi:hypothetical protein